MPYKDPEVRKQKSAERWETWAQRNPEKAKAKVKKWRQQNPRQTLLISARSRAQKKAMIFELTLDDIPDIPAVCPIAQIELKARPDGKMGPWDFSPTLDRIDDSKGYVPGNVRVISHRANRWKSNMLVEDVERLLKYMQGEL